MSDQSASRETSAVVALWRAVTAAFAHAGDSWVGRRLHSLSQGLTRAIAASSLASIGTRLAQWGRESLLYRWLTAEPDPEIIVIDLRETYTVGPVLAVLDRILDPLAGAWQSGIVGTGAQALDHELRRRPIWVVSVGVLCALLGELALSVVLGRVSQTGIGIRLLLVSLALVGTRIRISWAECTDSRTYQALATALAPPEPPTNDRDDSK